MPVGTRNNTLVTLKRQMLVLDKEDDDANQVSSKKGSLWNVITSRKTIRKLIDGQDTRSVLFFLPGQKINRANNDCLWDAIHGAVNEVEAPKAMIKLPEAAMPAPHCAWTNSEGAELMQALIEHVDAERTRTGLVERVQMNLTNTRPGAVLDVLHDKPYFRDMLAEMAVHWMDVRWRALVMFPIGRQHPAMPLPPKGAGAATQRTMRDTQDYVNAFVHGANLRHDTLITTINYAMSRLDDNLTSDYFQLLQKRQFEEVYKLKLDEAEWLVQQAHPEPDPKDTASINWARVINIIDRYVSCYDIEGRTIKIARMSAVGGGTGPVANYRVASVALWTRFMGTLSTICTRGVQKKDPPATVELGTQLRAEANSLIAACVQWGSWTAFDSKPQWSGTQAELVREKLRSL